MAQQTAVEWFYQRILAKDIKEVFEQAKQMEKEQIIEAFKEGYINGALEDHEYKGDDYFNETFEK